MSRSRAARAAVAAAAFVLTAAPDAHAAVLMSEDFESVGSYATYFGSGSRDCTTANTLLCSVLVPASSLRVRSGARRTGTWAMSGPTTVSFAFKPDCITGDTDGDVTVTFDAGSVTVHVTEDQPTGNNGVSVMSATGAESRGFASWPQDGIWYTFTLVVDPSADTATATFGASTGTVTISPSATTVTAVEVNGINWSTGCNVHYDTVTLSG